MHRLSTVLVPIALLLSGCGGADTTSAPPATQNSTSPTSTASEEDTSAASDVKITSCVNNGWTQSVDIAVTNSTGSPWKYVVGVMIKDANGEQSEARFVENRIEPGKTVTEQIPGDTQLKGEITCEVGEAKRMPPQ